MDRKKSIKLEQLNKKTVGKLALAMEGKESLLGRAFVPSAVVYEIAQRS